jgi:hypothetical protein
MMFKFALVLLSTLASTSVLAGAGSKRLGQNDLDNQAEIARAHVEESASSLQDDETDDRELTSVNPGLRALGNNGGSDWDRGTYSVAHHSGNLKLYVPPATKVGDTLFLFLR